MSPRLLEAVFPVYSYKWQTRTVVTAGHLRRMSYWNGSIFSQKCACLRSESHRCMVLDHSITTVWLTETLCLPEMSKSGYIYIWISSPKRRWGRDGVSNPTVDILDNCATQWLIRWLHARTKREKLVAFSWVFLQNREKSVAQYFQAKVSFCPFCSVCPSASVDS